MDFIVFCFRLDLGFTLCRHAAEPTGPTQPASRRKRREGSSANTNNVSELYHSPRRRLCGLCGARETCTILWSRYSQTYSPWPADMTLRRLHPACAKSKQRRWHLQVSYHRKWQSPSRCRRNWQSSALQPTAPGTFRKFRQTYSPRPTGTTPSSLRPVFCANNNQRRWHLRLRG